MLSPLHSILVRIIISDAMFFMRIFAVESKKCQKHGKHPCSECAPQSQQEDKPKNRGLLALGLARFGSCSCARRNKNTASSSSSSLQRTESVLPPTVPIQELSRSYTGTTRCDHSDHSDMGSGVSSDCTIQDNYTQLSEEPKPTDDSINEGKESAMDKVRNNGIDLSLVDEQLKGDRDVVLAAVKNNGMALQFAFEELKADRDIVLEAVKNNGMALQFASEDIKGDILESLENQGRAL